MSNLSRENPKNFLLYISKLLKNLHDQVGHLFTSFGHDPTSGSIAFFEIQKNPEVDNAYIQASLLIEGAADHLYALSKLLIEPMSSIAPWTVVRGILEASAKASWFLDNKIDATSRLKRSFAFRYEGIQEQIKLGRTFQDEPFLGNAEVRLQRLERVGKNLELEVVSNRKGQTIGIGIIMPTITEVIRDTLDEEKIFRILSAMAHGHTWAYQQLGFVLTSSGSDLFLEKSSNLVSIGLLCATAINSFEKPVLLMVELMGWESEEILMIFRTTRNQLKEYLVI